MRKEKVIERIANLLDLANNNTNENEAIAASLKAQELMAKYHIELCDLGTEDQKKEEPIEEFQVNTNYGNYSTWKYELSTVIAKKLLLQSLQERFIHRILRTSDGCKNCKQYIYILIQVRKQICRQILQQM